MKLVGYVDGVEVSFSFYPPNTFKAIIPKRLNGKYIVELKAIDDAGNENGETSIYMYIDFQSMHFKILNEKYMFNIDENNTKFIEVENIYDSIECINEFSFKEIFNQYSYRELVIR